MIDWKKEASIDKAVMQDVEKGIFSGAYKAEIVLARHMTYDGNESYQAVDIKVKLKEKLNVSFKDVPKPNKKSDDIFYDKIEKKYYKIDSIVPVKIDEPKTYNLRKAILMNSYGSKNVSTVAIFQSLMYSIIKNPKFNIADVEANVYDFDLKEMVTKPVLQYEELIGKEVGILIKMSHRFKKTYVDGYNNQEVFTMEDKQSSTSVKIKNYDLGRNLQFDVDHWFNWETYQTISEVKNKIHAKTIFQVIHRLVDWNEPMPTKKEQDDERRKALKTKLSKARTAFDEYEFVSSDTSSNSQDASSIEDDEDVPF